jgi:hypothetical protein
MVQWRWNLGSSATGVQRKSKAMRNGECAHRIPPATMRLMTAERPDGVKLPDDMTNYPGRSGKFMLKLLGAWMAMGFRRPAVEGVP